MRWVQELSEKIRAEGFKTDKPVVIFKKGGSWLVIDGFHRLRAAVLAGLSEVPTQEFKGTWAEALLYGVAQNKAHGMKLDPHADYKMAAKKLHAAGVSAIQIADALFGKVRAANRHHPRLVMIQRWLGIANQLKNQQRANKKMSVGATLTKRVLAEDPDLDIAALEPEDLIERATKSERAKAELEGRQAAAASIFKGLSAPVQTPDWARTEFATPDTHGVPVLFLSDVHAGEVVNRAEMQGRNEYDWQIMEKRLDKLFTTAGYLPTLLVTRGQLGYT